MLIKVTPNSKTFSLQQKNGVWNARVPAKPAENAANAKLLTELEKITNKRVHLVKGAKSRDKTIIADGLTDLQLHQIFEKNSEQHTGGM